MAHRKKVRTVFVLSVATFCIVQYSMWRNRYMTQHDKAARPTVIMSERRNASTTEDTDKYQNETKQMVKRDQSIRKDAEMKARVVHLRKKCETFANQSNQTETSRTAYLTHVIVDPKNKMLFCLIPKVANTNFRRIFLAMAGVVSKETAANLSGDDVYIKYNDSFLLLQDFVHQKRKEMLQSYRKIIFVRQPMEKLLSGFKNKFYHPNIHASDKYYNAINRFYNRFSTLGKNKLVVNGTTRTITFTEFLTYWTDLYELGMGVDEHFDLASTVCSPCTVSYDFIGKYESLSDDAAFIFDKLNFDMQFPERNDNYSVTETADLLQEYYKDVPKPLLRKVQNILSDDFELFGYNLPDWVV